ncbi:formate dehydrogenase subunit beta [Kushneria phyllosphaerae]|uniref:Formate dehydrogenase iron-sulfur subunit n=1 Tax=Kushneria phyllosphaerae TaxID=2100822 RepID=A0A2R8CGY2_9GAMM|nr:formate dehydrogenase subunit beta [Kushneria phyllosphaerae]SPJ32014.1 Formate dehydrogenase, nitrate-inducible, iron-sulfur subunit [Kushneria phyllosphaerae]
MINSQNIVARSATTLPAPHARDNVVEVAKLIDVSKCIGCKACQVACMEWNDLRDDVGECHGVYDNPMDLTAESWTVMRFNEVETDFVGGDDVSREKELSWLIRKDGCMHCAEPGCLEACPAPGAIVQYANGIVDFDSNNCIGCGYCITGCPFNIPRISEKDSKSYKCTLCSDRVNVGLEPACVKACPTNCIEFGSKKDMLARADKRVNDLKERGYEHAGIYDPAGVGGTHVMYVLHHSDEPGLYSGLAKDPRISPVVGAWKGITKPIMSAILGITAFAGFFHYITKGPKEEPTDEEVFGEGDDHHRVSREEEHRS